MGSVMKALGEKRSQTLKLSSSESLVDPRMLTIYKNEIFASLPDPVLGHWPIQSQPIYPNRSIRCGAG